MFNRLTLPCGVDVSLSGNHVVTSATQNELRQSLSRNDFLHSLKNLIGEIHLLRIDPLMPRQRVEFTGEPLVANTVYFVHISAVPDLQRSRCTGWRTLPDATILFLHCLAMFGLRSPITYCRSNTLHKING